MTPHLICKFLRFSKDEDICKIHVDDEIQKSLLNAKYLMTLISRQPFFTAVTQMSRRVCSSYLAFPHNPFFEPDRFASDNYCLSTITAPP